jgi:hypothetical protein
LDLFLSIWIRICKLWVFVSKFCRFCVKENMEQADRHAMERRMTILAGHLEQPFFSGTQQQQLEASIVSAEIAPSPGGGAGTLSVIDNRTGKRYQLEISDAGTVKATDFKKITAGGDGNGLKLYDPGYLNTAPVRSSISYIDGDQGILRYRGYPIEELAEKSSYLEVAYLLLYGNLPTKLQLSDWEATIAQHSAVPQGVLDIIAALPHDAHPMGMLIGSICTLSSFHADANPALQGQDLYNSKSVRDKQIVRIIGKVRESLLSLFFPPQGDLLLSVYIARLLRIPHLLPFKCFRLFILSTVLDVFKLCNFWDSVSGANISSCSIFADGWKAASVAFQPAFLLREFPLHAGLSG